MNDPTNFRLLEKSLVETGLPAHLMFLLTEECVKKGWEFRPDIPHKLNVAAIEHLEKCDELTIARVAKKTDDLARTMLRDLNQDDPVDALHTCAMFCLKLVDEGLYAAVRNMSIVVSLMLITHLRDDSDAAEYAVKETTMKAGADKLLTKASLLGYYDIRNPANTPAKLLV